MTGTLHMGHAFQQTLMDVLTRWHRMRGDNVLWQPGTDHAGIATQMVVERQLEQEGTSRRDLGREKFVERVWAWKEQSGSTITRQMRRLGASCDWSREYFTMDEARSRAVTEVFVRLHEEGLIYRGKRLVNWDPVLHTAVSDLEVESREENGIALAPALPARRRHRESLVVATTRPETMLGDTAVAVHPEDERYRHLIGKQVRLPLADRLIPVIADEYVDREFGTGCVKITPAHDFNDYQLGARHGLADDQHLHPRREGERERAARPTAASTASRRGSACWPTSRSAGLVDSVKPHKLMQPRSQRSDAVVEPMLSDQWFVAMDGFAKAGLDAVAAGRTRFVPDMWATVYNQWLENIQDWCISRQLWWGHQIPAWYAEDGTPFVGRTFEEASAKAKAAGKRDLARRARPRRARHLVLVGLRALLHARLARRGDDGEGAALLPALLRPHHRLRHHLLLGGAHDHDDAPLHRERCRSATSTSTPSCATPRARRCRSRRATPSTRST